jgi:heptosyltransferase-3
MINGINLSFGFAFLEIHRDFYEICSISTKKISEGNIFELKSSKFRKNLYEFREKRTQNSDYKEFFVTYGDYPDLSGVKRVLVVKLRHLGDVLLTTPVFTHLKKAIPGALIDAYVYEEAKPMLEGHPLIHDLIGYDRKWKKKGFFHRLRKEWSQLRAIRKKRYDLVINLTEGDRGVFVALVSGAKIRVGFTPKGKWKKKLFTHVVKHCPGLRHTVERNLDAIRRIGIFPGSEERGLFFQVKGDVLLSMRQKVGLSPFTLIHPTSRWRFKCWSVDLLRTLIQRLLNDGKRIVLTAGPDPIETAMVQLISEGLDVIVLAGRTSLKELGALILLSEMLVCVDSVPLHMASALKHPVVALFGPTSDVTWGPWQNPKARIVSQNFSCRPCYQDGCGGSKYSDCLQTLPVESVLRAIESLSGRVLKMIH